MILSNVKIISKKGQPPQAEVSISTRLANILIVVGLDGYTYKHYNRNDRWSSTRGKNIHLALNGPAMLTFEELEELVKVVNQAKQKLEELT